MLGLYNIGTFNNIQDAYRLFIDNHMAHRLQHMSGYLLSFASLVIMAFVIL
jgi:hypothetical protein